jgi:hypothetical protein
MSPVKRNLLDVGATNKIGDAFAAALEQMLQGRHVTITTAARELGVSRQSFHSYLVGKLPRRETLNKAVHMWDLKLDVGKSSFNKGAFGPVRQGAPIPKPSQPTLWEALDAVPEKDLHVTMKRVGKVLRVNVSIEIPA